MKHHAMKMSALRLMWVTCFTPRLLYSMRNKFRYSLHMRQRRSQGQSGRSRAEGTPLSYTVKKKEWHNSTKLARTITFYLVFCRCLVRIPDGIQTIVVFLISSRQMLEQFLQLGHRASLHVRSYSPFTVIQSFFSIQSELSTASLHKKNSVAWVRKRTIPTDWATAACRRS
jgi:hypothetical protein